MDKKNGIFLRAYFTLEMSLIFPVVVFVMTLIIHFAFYLYGRCIISQDVYLLALRASRANEDEIGMSREDYAMSISDAQFGSKYLGNLKPTIRVEASGKSVKVDGETESSHKAMSWFSMMPTGSWTHGAGARADVLDPPSRIRRLDRLGDIANGLIDSDGNE